MEKNFIENVTRGVRESIPNIIQIEIWKNWEKVVDIKRDSVIHVKLQKHKVMDATQRIVYSEGFHKSVKNVRTEFAVDNVELVITYFDGEATLLLLDEAYQIFGDLITE